MGISKQMFLKFIGISAGLHLVIGALAIFYTIPPVNPGTLPESVIEVSLINRVDAVAAVASIRRPVKASPRVRTMREISPAADEGDSMQRRPAEIGEDAIPLEAIREETISSSAVPSAASPEKEDPSSSGPVEQVAFNTMTQTDGTAGVIDPIRNEMTRFLQDVRSRLEQAKRYPWLARVRGQEGAAQIRFRILPGGEPAGVQIVKSSEFPILDREAVATVKRVSRFPRPPMDRDIDLVVPMVFRLNVPKDP